MNLLNNAVRLRIQGCPFLPGGIHLCELQSHLVVLLVTAQTVHRLLLPHPARLYRSVSAGSTGAGDPVTIGRVGERAGDSKYSGNKKKSGGLGNLAVFCSGTCCVSSLGYIDCGDNGVELLLGMNLGFSRAFPGWIVLFFFSSAEEAAGWFCLGWNLYVADGS